MNKNKVIVVGAGPAGLTAAWELVQKGMEVIVLESDPKYVGGLARTVQWSNFRFDLGGHRFFSKNPTITEWWKSRLGKDFIEVKRLSRIIYDGKFFDYPLKPWNALSGLGMQTSAHCVASFLKRQIVPIRPEDSFEDWVINRFGDRLYSIFFKTYTEKVWGIPCRSISADWASQRIQGLSLGKAVWSAFAGKPKAKTLIPQFQYPRYGAGMMWEKTRDEIVERGAKVFMGQSVHRFERDQGRVIAAWTRSRDGQVQRHEGNQFIISMPLKDCISALDEPVDESVRRAAQRLTYREFVLVVLVINRGNLFPDNWIYVHTPDLKVGRIQNYNNWGDGMVGQKGVTSLALEYFCSGTDDFWKMSDSQFLEMAKFEVERLGLARSSEILDGCVVKAEKAYPVYDVNYRQNVMKIRNELKVLANFQVIGRNGMHKYNNQDHSMLTGILAAENVVRDRARWHDLWSVNTSAEYHEAGNADGERPAAFSAPDEKTVSPV
jgi:protoporphyrinogen oxidase